jgi:hypothetical protein
MKQGSGSRSSVEKPLPGPPGKRASTRGSSRSTHLPDYSSRRTSNDVPSGSRPQSNNSQTNSGRGTPSTSLSVALLGPGATPKEGTPRKAAIPAKTSQILEDWQNENRIELPADVPEEVMRNAPVSVKNRLSMTLGLKPKDNADHRISSIYYPKALGDLLKIPQSPQIKTSPQLVTARATAVRSSSPLTDSDADYFSAHERSPSIGHITPNTRQFLDSAATTPENVVPRISIRSPTIQQNSPQQRSSAPNPGLTSHPSVMQMASPPVELSAVIENQEGTHSARSRQESQSSLGEPGPEIAEASSESDSYHRADVEISIIPPEGLGLSKAAVHELGSDEVVTPKPSADVEPKNSEKAAEEIPATGQAVTSEPADHSAQEGTAASGSINKKGSIVVPVLIEHKSEVEQKREMPLDISTEEEKGSGGLKSISSAEEDLAEMPTERSSSERPANEDTITTFIAELEALPAMKPTRPVTMQPSSPIELEAPVQTFVLPPRSKAKLSQGKDYSSATIKDRADFFKLPSEQTVKPVMKPRDFKGLASQEPGPVRPLKLKMQKFEGKLVPVQVHTPPKGLPDEPVRTSRLSQDVIAKLIDQISKTPKGTPAHSRTGSGASAKSSRSLGPPESAPAPPGPGGRAMVSPDYASIGQFEGERKHSNKSSKAGSMGGLKEILSGSRKNSSDSSARSHGRTGSSRVQSLSARGSGSDMLTSAGKDVLWFRDGKNRESGGGVGGVKGEGELTALP